MIEPADMLLFAAVVREGSFTAAATALGITKQSVSERVSKLERQLGVRLLERSTRSLRPTDAGARYYERCAVIAAQVDEANREVQRIQVEPTGLLRISAPMLYGRRYLAPVVADFLERYPQLRVELMLVDRRVNLVEEGFDLAIRVGELDDSSLTARKLTDAYVYHVASPRYLSRQGHPRHAHELRQARCITLRPHETWVVKGEPVKIEPVLVLNDLEACCDAALAHIGIAQLPSIVCGEPVRRGELVTLFGLEPTYTLPIHAIFPSRQYLPPKVRLFMEALVERVAPMSPLAQGGRRPRGKGPLG
jgi:DNA-binding transcriptional LysR family regulator